MQFIAQIYDFLAPLNGQVNNNALALIRRANEALDDWWSNCDELHRQYLHSYFDLQKPKHHQAGPWTRTLCFVKFWQVNYTMPNYG